MPEVRHKGLDVYDSIRGGSPEKANLASPKVEQSCLWLRWGWGLTEDGRKDVLGNALQLECGDDHKIHIFTKVTDLYTQYGAVYAV